MLSKALEKALNEQVTFEFYSAYTYLGMSSYLEGADFPGMAAWMKHQAQEEMEHGMKLYAYVHERLSEVELGAIAKVPTEYASPLAVFQTAYDHEKEVTRRIVALFELAKADSDYAAMGMLQWYLNEQVEEESNFDHIVTLLKRAGENNGALMILDGKLAARAS